VLGQGLNHSLIFNSQYAKKNDNLLVYTLNIGLHYLLRDKITSIDTTINFDKWYLAKILTLYRSARENSCLDRFLLVTQSANRICHDMFPATQEGVQSCLMHVYSAKRNPSPIEDAEIHEACESRGFNEVYHFATVFLCM
jgi:hypothetical protein